MATPRIGTPWKGLKVPVERVLTMTVTCACGDNEPIQDDERLEEFNVPLFTYSASLAAIAMSLLYRPDSDGTVHLLWPMGVGRSRLLSLQMYTALAQPPHSPGSFLPARRSRTSSTPMHAAISRTWTS